ncbi:hypothetical protein [Rhizobium sp. Root1220]|uniref:hypothetical protein n=1 Tax=Rhizobium sp. Root1220 TaxID=1736432 RepID=UPI0006FE1DE1|nr:hypothetical protein [Rhizobium sp. Root1220]KQV84052.1 hypothetical protein ASC90_00560 [Rhizobium sp. Root1220]
MTCAAADNMTPPVPLEAQKEILLKWADISTGQINDLWLAGIAFLGISTLVLAQVLKEENKTWRTWLVAIFLSIGAMAALASLFFGFSAKGVVALTVRNLLTEANWCQEVDKSQFNAVWQFNSLAASVISFVIATLLGLSRVGKAIGSVFTRG